MSLVSHTFLHARCVSIAMGVNVSIATDNFPQNDSLFLKAIYV